MKTYKEFIIEDINRFDVIEVQKFAQRLFNKCKTHTINFRIATHSFNNFNNSRNEAPITKASVIRIFKRGIPKVCKNIEDYTNEKICLCDNKTNLHIPLTITDGADNIVYINTNSAQNKGGYWLPKNQIPIYIN